MADCCRSSLRKQRGAWGLLQEVVEAARGRGGSWAAAQA
jgi:hypothetical protein